MARYSLLRDLREAGINRRRHLDRLILILFFIGLICAVLIPLITVFFCRVFVGVVVCSARLLLSWFALGVLLRSSGWSWRGRRCLRAFLIRLILWWVIVLFKQRCYTLAFIIRVECVVG